MDGHKLRMIETLEPDSWGVKVSDAKLGKDALEIKNLETQVLIEPMVPYIYLPVDDFRSYQTLIERVYPFQVNCSLDRRVCFFTQDCEALIKQDTEFSFKLGVDLPINMKLEDLFTEGMKVDGTFDTCYIPIFLSEHADQTKWLLGNVFMQQFYTVFDMD